jgi:hypothetical protein
MGADGAGALEVGPGQRREEALFTVEGFGPLEEDGVWDVGRSGYSDEEMEVIGHHAIGEDFHPTELSEREEQIDQTLFGQLIERSLYNGKEYTH